MIVLMARYVETNGKISQSAGGIGLAIHNVRATGSYIRGTNGTSNRSMLRVFNDCSLRRSRWWKAQGSFAIYIETTYDIFDFLRIQERGNAC
jgi:ribonucleoside-diphosphate reductase alpha chain